MKIGGARVSLSKSGIGTSFGVKGARYSVHSSGRRTTSVGIPGSGLGYVSSKGGSSRTRTRGVSTPIGMTPSQQQKFLERHAKKIQLASERRNKPFEALKNQYATGKITKAVYDGLARRDSDVTIDLMIFGRSAGVKLAERYVIGKIDNNEFEALKNEILGEPEAEKDSIIESYKTVVKYVNDFVEKARSQKSNEQCNNCNKQKKFFSPLYTISDFKLCGSCRRHFNRISSYPGFTGQYYASESSTIDPDAKNSLSLSILPHHVIEYR